MKIRVKKGQVVHTDGAVHTEGNELDLPKPHAMSLVRSGRAEEVTEKAAKPEK